MATGRAFVGNVKAVDRMIWTAIGSTTNLAARLQSMTRELGAAIVVDEETWRRAGDLADRFERQPQVRIRGLTEREDLYLLRLGETPSSD